MVFMRTFSSDLKYVSNNAFQQQILSRIRTRSMIYHAPIGREEVCIRITLESNLSDGKHSVNGTKEGRTVQS